MPEDFRHQQRWLVTVVAILVILLIMVILGLVRSIPARSSGPQIGHRSPAVELAYCQPDDTRLCVVSFEQIEGGDMLVNFQLPSIIYPPFILVINRHGVESAYECRRTKGFLGGVTCSGVSQVPGEILQFKLIALRDGALIAEGKFPIIGIAIATPVGPSTPTEAASGTPTGNPTALLPTQQFSTPTPSTSYPAPPTSYPDPSYP